MTHYIEELHKESQSISHQKLYKPEDNAVTSLKYVCMYVCMYVCVCVFIYLIYFWECVIARAEEGQGERKTDNAKQAPCCQCRAQCRAQTHDL